MSIPERRRTTIDGNEAVASVAHRTNEVIAIYPITPASSMGELCDEWSSAGRRNLWGEVPRIVEMQSEAGAAGAVHGALQAGTLATTFTSSQGLLLMIPNMYKIAGEQTPFVLHVAARALAAHALSIFGDHSDVMACRQTGFALLCSSSVQEAHDFAAIATAATLRSRVPFLHFFDGFRTSHEVATLELLSDGDLLSLLDEEAIAAHRLRALTPDRPAIRGTAQNPDTFFQAREAANPLYDACPRIVQEEMDRFAALTGRAYRIYDYMGHPEAERVVLLMGSAAETAIETIEPMVAEGEKVGVLKVRLYRPFDAGALIAALPPTVRRLAVLDRTKEPGALGDPLYLDVVAALAEERGPASPLTVAGRYGLSSKEMTPAMFRSILAELAAEKPRNHFTIGINDDVTHRSLPFDRTPEGEPEGVVAAVFFGLGSDGTVGSNKQTIKIIAESPGVQGQGYFVYDSKKSGSVTVSHLRFGPRQIRSAWLIQRASFVACHQPQLLERHDVLANAGHGATFLLNTPYGPERIWDELPREVQEQILEKELSFYVIDGFRTAEEAGLGKHISTVMQTCFFALSGVLPREKAIEKIKASIEKSYGKRGPEVVKRNFAAVDAALDRLHRVDVPRQATATRMRPLTVPREAPPFVQQVTAAMLAGKGDLLPVSAFPIDGTWPVATSRWEKRAIAREIPLWDESLCIQCNKCALVCPHAAIRTKVADPALLADAPEGYRSMSYKSGDLAGQRYTVQVSPDDCTGCELCVEVCPAKDKKNPEHKALNLVAAAEHRERENAFFGFFEALPEADRTQVPRDLKGSQLLQPLFEFSGACSGCGETPYVKLLTQLYGDRLLIANATGCSSIYGGNLPTTPYCTDASGRGPAWANSLFEDNAEFGLGFRLAVDAHGRQARSLVRRLAGRIGDELAGALLEASQEDEAAIASQRGRVDALRGRLRELEGPDARRLELLADYLVRKSVWIVGGDGWAYDIGYGGLDHVLASDQDVNILVLDTQVYSNTGGQQSKATPLGAAAKFAVAGKSAGRKDLGLLAMSYGHAYVASVALGARDAHTVKVLQEAESFPGPSLVIAYSHCIAHGYDLTHGLEHQKGAVDSGAWPLFRFDPRRQATGEAPLQLDSGAPKSSLGAYMAQEDRFRMVQAWDPARYEGLVRSAENELAVRRAIYEQLAGVKRGA